MAVSLPRTSEPVARVRDLHVTFRRTTSDDDLHPDYRMSVGPLRWSSPHHGRDFRRSALHQRLFPVIRRSTSSDSSAAARSSPGRPSRP